MNNIRAYISYISESKRWSAFSIFLSCIQASALVPTALIVQRIFDHVLPAKDSSALVGGLIVILGLFALHAGAVLWNRQVTLERIKQSIHSMRHTLVNHTLEWSRHQYTHEHVDDLHSKIVHDTERIDCMMSAFLTQFFPGLIVSIGLSFILMYENMLLFLIIICTLPVLYGAAKLLGRGVRRRVREFHSDFSEFSSGILFVLKFNELIKISTAEQHELDVQNAKIEQLRHSSHAMAWYTTAYTLLQYNILMIAGVIVLLAGGLQVIHGNMTVGTLLSFYFALNLLNSNARNALSSVPVMIEGKESLDAVMAITNIQKNQTNQTKKSVFNGFRKNIVFDKVTFGHEPARPIINALTFSISKGETFGIYGASGTGKTTLINLLLGFYEPQAGTLSIDGQSILAIDLKPYRSQIGVVTQDMHVFPGTIRDNLTYGLRGITDADLDRVCKICSIYDDIHVLPQGYDTMLGERGMRLSGGQKQRLTLARALLRSPSILILDEPDNHLDEVLFTSILKQIKSLELTTIVISHHDYLRPYLDHTITLT